MANGEQPVRTLRGDLDRNGTVTTDDGEAVRLHSGQPVDGGNFIPDFDGNGRIAATEFSRFKALLGHTTPACP